MINLNVIIFLMVAVLYSCIVYAAGFGNGQDDTNVECTVFEWSKEKRQWVK